MACYTGLRVVRGADVRVCVFSQAKSERLPLPTQDKTKASGVDFKSVFDLFKADSVEIEEAGRQGCDCSKWQGRV